MGGAAVELWTGMPGNGGTRIASCPVKDSLGWETYAVTTCALTAPASGTHDVYLKVIGQPGSELLRIASLQFAP